MRASWLVLLFAACTASAAAPDGDDDSMPEGACAWDGRPFTPEVLEGPATAVADVTGDDRDDWVVSTAGGRVLLAGPWPGRPWAILDDGDEYFVHIRAEDLDDDGHRDLIVARPWQGEIAVFFGPIDVDATLAVAAAPLRLSSPQDGLLDLFGSAMVAGDLTGDGSTDLLVGAPAEGEEACSGTHDLTLWPGPLRPGHFFAADAPRRIAAAPGSCLGNALALAQLDSDPDLELMVAAASAAYAFELPLDDATDPTELVRGYYPVGATDVDGDGVDDIVMWYGAIALASGERHEIPADPAASVVAHVPGSWLGAGTVLVHESGTPSVRRLVVGAPDLQAYPVIASGDAVGEQGINGTMSTADVDDDGGADLVVGASLLRCRRD